VWTLLWLKVLVLPFLRKEANTSTLISTSGQRPRDRTFLPQTQFYSLLNVAMVIKMRVKDHLRVSLYRPPGYLMVVYSLSSLVHAAGIWWYFHLLFLSTQCEFFCHAYENLCFLFTCKSAIAFRYQNDVIVKDSYFFSCKSWRSSIFLYDKKMWTKVVPGYA
jgi:hypothetical protein